MWVGLLFSFLLLRVPCVANFLFKAWKKLSIDQSFLNKVVRPKTWAEYIEQGIVNIKQRSLMGTPPDLCSNIVHQQYCLQQFNHLFKVALFSRKFFLWQLLSKIRWSQTSMSELLKYSWFMHQAWVNHGFSDSSKTKQKPLIKYWYIFKQHF